MRLSGPKGFSPTPEQEAALRRFRSGASFKLVAVAGSGKTSTLRYLAQESLRESLLYLAFNRAVREEAEIRFPRNTYVKTLHGFAHDHVVKGNRAYEQKVRRSDGKVSIADVQERLDPEDPVLAYVLRETLERFIRSTDPWPQPHHLPREWAQRKQVAEELIENILDGVWELWQAMVDENDPFPLSHDGYVRLWRERGAGDRPPSVDAVLVDEAQDLDPNFQAILQAWKGKVQLVLVGDPRQQIYAWRGAVNAMAGVNLPESQLSWSFRFGEGLARFVREVTSRQSQGPVGVVGKANWPTEVNSARPSYPFTVLTRTNLGLLEALLELGQDLPRGKAHVVGGVKEVVQLLEDLADLKEGVPRRHPHPDLLIVESWKEAWELAQVNPFLKGLLKLARKYPDLRGLADRVKAMHAFEEEGVSLVLSTAHKAKGREWDRVLLWRDFLWKGAGRWLRGEGPPAKVSPELQEEENLFYVAITRAKEHLSLEKLSGNVEEEEEDLSPALIFPLKTKVSSPSSHEGQKVVSLPPEEAPLGLQTMAEADGAWDFILRYLRDRDGSIRFQAYLVYEDILKLSPFLPPGFTAPVPPSYLPTTQEMQRWLDSMTRISEEAGVEGVAWDFLEEEAHLGAIPVKAGSLLEGVSRETLLAFLWFLQAVAIYMGTGKLLYRKIMAGEDPGRVREAFFFAARARRMEILGEALDIGRKWKAVAHTAEGTLVGWYAWAKSHFHERLTSPSDVRFRSGAPPLQDLSYRKDKFPQPSSLAQLEAALRAYAPLTRGREDIFHRRIRYLKKHYGVKGLQALYEALSSGEVDPITCTWLNGPRLAQRLGLEYEV